MRIVRPETPEDKGTYGVATRRFTYMGYGGGKAYVQALREIVVAHPDQTVLVVSHVTPIKTLLQLALDAGPGILYRLHIDIASLSIAEFYPDGSAAVRLGNQTADL